MFHNKLFRYEKYVEYAYVQYLKTHNKPDEVSTHILTLFHLHPLLLSP